MNHFQYREGYPAQTKLNVRTLLTILAVAEIFLLIGALMVSPP